ncbi:MAG: thymidylate kinase [Armatimonadetes bacterium]|nr:thymidylate kinase [Armatimonadota bacterium]
MRYDKDNGKQIYGTLLPNLNPASLKGRLIVVEGADGSGRSTQVGLLQDWLEENGYATVQVGLKRSMLAGQELERAMQGHTLSPITFSLFYATDFADQLEQEIIPALRADFIVLADRYIYTTMVRDIARGMNPDWVRDVYSIALVPDIIFYLDVSPKVLAERTLRKNSVLSYWESGMDIRRSGDWYECFIRYQRQVHKVFEGMATAYGFEVVDGNRTPLQVAADLRRRMRALLGMEARSSAKKARKKRRAEKA